MNREVAVAGIAGWLDRRLRIAAFPADHSNNGLQVEAAPAVRRIAAGVDASQALFDAAVERGADLVMVHHGLSWGAEPRRLTGRSAALYGTLFRNGVSLYACHLPLDAQPEIGNNAVLSDMLGLAQREPFYAHDGVDIGFSGRLAEAATAAALAERLLARLPGDVPVCCEPESRRPFTRVGVVSGGGGLGAVEAAAAAGCGALVTGEMTHVMYHAARELGVAVVALGHYRSETVGIRALLDEAMKQFELPGEFIDVPTGL